MSPAIRRGLAAAAAATDVAGALVLGIETSCDETSAAVLRAPRDVVGHVILSQDAHALYGGVVPEIASRAHLVAIDDVVDGALAEAGVTLDDDQETISLRVLRGSACAGLFHARRFEPALPHVARKSWDVEILKN
jgi:hypothetical protein